MHKASSLSSEEGWSRSGGSEKMEFRLRWISKMTQMKRLKQMIQMKQDDTVETDEIDETAETDDFYF